MTTPELKEDARILLASIDFQSQDVFCFDPEKVAHRAQQYFGDELAIDPTDHAAGEIEDVETFLAGKPDADPEQAQQMRDEVRVRARRNGPVYQFVCTPASGEAWAGVLSRYSVTCFLPRDVAEDYRDHVFGFLNALRIGRLQEIVDGEARDL